MEHFQKSVKFISPTIVWGVGLGVAFAVGAALLFFGAVSYFGNVEYERAQSRVSLYRSTLIGALQRFQHLPFILAQDPYVIAGAAGIDRDGLNVRLADFAKSANLDAIYLMDKTGETVSASNFSDEVTFLGQNYGFRPYFKDAMAGKRGEFFGIGATTLKPGYFIAEQVLDPNGEILGVIALKLDLSDLTSAWREGGETVFASNDDGVVVLSSEESWRYQTLFPISEGRRQAIAIERQFASEPLMELGWREFENTRVELNGRNYIYAAAPVLPIDWKLYFLADESRVWERAWFTLIGFGIVALGLVILAIILRAQRIRQALRISQADRRELRGANALLALEIEERRMAEMQLERAQTELARSSKLAALGQLSASVTHELGQPISAMQNYLKAAEFDKDGDERKNSLERLGGIARRMVSITRQLRFFAQPGQSTMEQVDLTRVWKGAFLLVEADLKQKGVDLNVNIVDTKIIVLGNRLRLEQVLINLLRNSISALEDQKNKTIKVDIGIEGEMAIITISDNGHGLGAQTMDQMKEPFHTTKASGNGMGLGLAISTAIVVEHGGQLRAKNGKKSGAVFTLELPIELDSLGANGE
ncbi:MAG: ATP-binding protein [Devosiaceae bacterium]|nr:ATP-binding protein [Devosiaceae bacterium]